MGALSLVGGPGERGASRWEARPLAGGVGEVRCGARAAAGLSERVRGWLGRSEVRERAERVWAGGLGFSQWAGLGFFSYFFYSNSNSTQLKPKEFK